MFHDDAFLIGFSRGAYPIHNGGRYSVPTWPPEHRVRRAFGRGLQWLGSGLSVVGARLARPSLPTVPPEWFD
jgi:hypothetical protein